MVHKKNNVFITSDGTSRGTKVIDANTGEDLTPYITKITWEVDAKNNMAKACIYMTKMPSQLAVAADLILNKKP